MEFSFYFSLDSDSSSWIISLAWLFRVDHDDEEFRISARGLAQGKFILNLHKKGKLLIKGKTQKCQNRTFNHFTRQMYIFILLTSRLRRNFYVISGGKIIMMPQLGVLHFLHLFLEYCSQKKILMKKISFYLLKFYNAPLSATFRYT